MCDHVTGRVVWAAKGRSKDTVGKFLDVLGDRAANLAFVTADGATWITDVVAERAPDAIMCLDTFHVIGRATTALDEVCRQNGTRSAGPGEPKRPRSSRGCGSCYGGTGRTSPWANAR